MKEMLKSKSILLFIVIMFGFFYVGGDMQRAEVQNVEDSYFSENLD